METKILKVVYRMDGKYDCELAVIGSNKNLKICLTIEDIDLKPLNDSLQKFLTEHPTVIEQARTLEAIDAEVKDTSYKDEVGGVHDEGCGWNPQGAFCGECGSTTCKNCISQFEEPLKSPEKVKCDYEQCSFPECHHVCGYNPDKDDPKPKELCKECGGACGYDFGIPVACKHCHGTGYEPELEQSPEGCQAAVGSKYCTCSTPEFEETHPYGWLACTQCGKLKE